MSGADPRPRHEQIADDLRRQIRAAVYGFAVGDKIPSLQVLSAAYDCSEPTVHQAVRTLQREGLLVSTSGRGTYVQAVPTENVNEIADLRARVDHLERRISALEERDK